MTLLQVPDGLDRQVAGGNTWRGNVPFADASAFQDPLVGGFHHGFKVFIGENTGRNVSAESSYFGARRTGQSISPSMITTKSQKPNSQGCPKECPCDVTGW